MTGFRNKFRKITGVATAAAAASVIGLTALGAGASPVMAATTDYITQAKAKTAALNHAKLTASKVYDVDIELEKGKKQAYYDIEFKANGYEYDYEINATNATIIKSSKKAIKAKTTTKTTTSKTTAAKKTTTSYIGVAKAKNIALNHAKLTASKVTKMKAELDKDKGIYIYEVEFRYGNYEYEYDINATTGKIIKFDKEYKRK